MILFIGQHEAKAFFFLFSNLIEINFCGDLFSFTDIIRESGVFASWEPWCSAVFLNLYHAVAHFKGQQIFAAHFNEIITMSVSLE